MGTVVAFLNIASPSLLLTDLLVMFNIFLKNVQSAVSFKRVRHF